MMEWHLRGETNTYLNRDTLAWACVRFAFFYIVEGNIYQVQKHWQKTLFFFKFAYENILMTIKMQI